MTLNRSCDMADCERKAAWVYVGESGDIYLCEAHYTPDDGWTCIASFGSDECR